MITKFGLTASSKSSYNIQSTLVTSDTLGTSFSVRNNGESVIAGCSVKRGGGLGLEIPVIYELCGDPKYLVRLDKLINSSESAKE